MKKIIGFVSIVLTSLILLFVITSCANSTNNNNNNGNQELSNVTSTNPNEPSQTEPSNPDTSDNPGTDENVYYTITFKDYDGTVLQTSNVKKGETPTYNKTNPSRNNDDNYSYTFNGWNPSIETVSKDMVYTATYLSTKNSYTVIWKNWDGTVLEIDYNVEYGMTPIYNGATPTRQSNQNNNYVFNGWDKIITSVTKDIEYKATFEAVPVSLCIVNFDSKGGTSISSQSVIKGEKAKKPSNPTKEGYTFDDWYYQGERWSFIGYTVTETMTLEAKWDINYYNLNLNVNNSKAGIISNNSGSHYYNESITITATTNPGYTFVGWYDGDNLISEKPSYAFTMPAKNLSYTAKWSININTPYKVEHYLQNIDDDNYPTTPFETDNLTGTTDTLTNASVKTYEGFTSPSITQVNINGDGSTVIKLYYTRNSYDLSLSINNYKAGSITDVSGTYKYGKEITIKAETNPGYTFNGWYLNDLPYKEEESFTYTIGTSKVSFEARYTINKYTITLYNQATGVTISGITNGNEYEYDTKITLTATNIPDGYTIKWSRSNGIVNAKDSITFRVPAGDITITTTVVTPPYTRNGTKMYFGTYPQTKVTASETNGLSSITFDSSTWTSYKYYIESTQVDYMYYKDVDIDNNGTYDYRGVYFNQYRPYDYSLSSSTDNSCQYENGYLTNAIHWFSYDPIEWKILTESNGKALILANLILDSQDYYSSGGSSSFTHNGGTGYANNYELSSIRKFLNDNFYNTAFNDLQKAIIEETIVDNSAYSTGYSLNSYACNDTKDKLFLLSHSEATSRDYGLNSYSARRAKGSDYAKCQGLYVYSSTYSSNGNSYWWLRSPYYHNDSSACIVVDDGNVNSLSVLITSYGVRPACWITL